MRVLLPRRGARIVQQRCMSLPAMHAGRYGGQNKSEISFMRRRQSGKERVLCSA
jgi:hypothetical protein